MSRTTGPADRGPVVADGFVVTYAAVIRGPDGQRIATSSGDEPITYIHGQTSILEPLHAALSGRCAGDGFELVVAAADAAGERDPSLVRQVSRAYLAAPEVGAWVAFTEALPDGSQQRRSAQVVAFDDTTITLDGNPPLAGLSLHFEVEVLSVREATPEERDEGRPASFPFDLLTFRAFPGPVGAALRSVGEVSMFPPYPWGQWLYGGLLTSQLAHLSGDVIELGVGLGGMSVFLAKLTGRRLVALDSFEGLPEPHPVHDNPYFLRGVYDGETPLIDRVRALVVEHEVDAQVQLVPGFFEDTVGKLPPQASYVFAHLDSDLHASVLVSLEAVYDRVVDGGVIVIDDFFHPAQGPARALADFFNARGHRPVLQVVFPYSVGLVKGSEAAERAARAVDGNVYAFDWLRGDGLFMDRLRISVDRAAPRSRSGRNARDLLEVLSRPTPRASDVYRYLAALEDFWPTLAGGFPAVARI